MKRIFNKKVLFGILIFLSNFLIAIQIGNSATPINSCSKIIQPGEYYLNNNISASSTCIEISANNVVLDCRGYYIKGQQISNTYGISISRFSATDTNITIKNCIITSWYYGIYLVYAKNNTITNSTFSSNLYGIYFLSSSNNTIHSNIIQNSNNYGIDLYSSGSNLIYNNLFNNSNNFKLEKTIYFNYWNTTIQEGKRIYSIGKIGGNYWTNPSGNGFSDTCNDTNGDGFCDNPLIIDPDQTGNNTDYLPLSKNYTWIISISIESPKFSSTDKIISSPLKDILINGFAFYKSMIFSAPYSNKNVNFSYDGKFLGSNLTNSSGFYLFTFSIPYEGNYILKASAREGDIYGENSTSLLILSSPKNLKSRLTYHLGIEKENDVYRIGSFNGTIDNLNLTLTLFSNQLNNAYVCSYDRTEYSQGLALGLIHSYSKDKFDFVNFSTSSLDANYILELNQRLDGSSLILALTKGDCKSIDNKMYLVESQTIPSRAFSSFSFGLPIQNIFQIIASYDKIDLEGSLSFSKGSHLLCIEKTGISNTFKPTVKVRKC